MLPESTKTILQQHEAEVKKAKNNCTRNTASDPNILKPF